MTLSGLYGAERGALVPGDQAAELVGGLVAAGVELSLEGRDVVFSGPAHALAQETVDTLRVEKEAVVSLLERNRERGVVKLGPTSREQRRMEWRNRTDRNPATYNVCMRLDLLGDADPGLLARAADALAERHEILRTRFAWYGAHLLQEVMAPPRAVLQLLEPAALRDAGDEEVADWCARRGRAAFDLGAEPPARWCCAPIGPGRSVLLVTFHHIACDGWSIERLLRDLRTLCRAGTGLVDAASLPPVSMTPGEFARWESAWLTEERIEQARSFWTGELRGAALSPTLRRSGGELATGGEAASVVRTIPAGVGAGVAAAARLLATSEFPLYFAAFAMLLSEETGGRDCAVVIAGANRTRPEHEELVGLTRNAQPIRCSVEEGDTIDVVARRISTRVENALAYQWHPIDLIVPPDDAQGAADPRRLPITFGYEGPGDASLDCGGFSATVRDVYLGAARAGFSLLVRRRGDAAEAFFEYSKAQLSEADAGLLADRYVEIVTAETARWAAPPARDRTDPY
jgi:hypothetical protein